MQCPTVIMSKTPAARFDLWTSEVHIFSTFRTYILLEPKTQLFLKKLRFGLSQTHFLVHFFIYARFGLQKVQTNAHFKKVAFWAQPNTFSCPLFYLCVFWASKSPNKRTLILPCLGLNWIIQK